MRKVVLTLKAIGHWLVQDLPLYNALGLLIGLIVILMAVAFIATYQNPLFTYEIRLAALDTAIGVGTLLSLVTLAADVTRRLKEAGELPIEVGSYPSFDLAHSEIVAGVKKMQRKLRFARNSATAALVIRNKSNRRLDNLKLFIYKRAVLGEGVSYHIQSSTKAIIVEPYEAAYLVTIPTILTNDPVKLTLYVGRNTHGVEDERVFDLCIDIVAENRIADKQAVIRVEVPSWGKE